MRRLVMEFQQLVASQRQRRVGLTLVVDELDFVHSRRKFFDYRPDLAALDLRFRDVFQECDYRQ